MRRRISKLVVFLLLGAIVNVAVAWGCALSFRLSRAGPSPKKVEAIRMELEPEGGWSFRAIIRDEWPAVVFYYSYWDTRNERVDCDEVERSTDLRPFELAPSWADLRMPPAIDYEIRWVHAFGWPFVSMWREYSPSGTGYGWKVLHGFEVAFLHPDGSSPRAIPLDPIWPGFAINTIFYAAILGMLWLSPFVVRRVIRRNRGRCIKCGYDLRGDLSSGCSECGWQREDVS